MKGERNIEETGHERQIQEPREPRISTQVTPENCEKLGVGGAWVITGRGDVLHQRADQGLPAGFAKCLGGLIIREEAICKILFMAQNSVQSGDKKYMARLRADSLTSHCSDAYSSSLAPMSYGVNQPLTVSCPELHPPRIELKEALAVLCYVPAPCLCPKCVEETSTSA